LLLRYLGRVLPKGIFARKKGLGEGFLRENESMKIMKQQITEAEFGQLIRDGVNDFSGYTMDVVTLYCDNNQLTSLPDLPNVVKLHCDNNQLTALPDLPNVVELYCSNNQLTSLPDLPNVVKLYCKYNQLTALPELPNVVVLDCDNNQLTSLPDLPNVVKLHCDNNQLTALPDLPNVVTLYCYKNQLTALPNYINSPTSGRSVVYLNGKILTGCFCGTLEEFYQKGYLQEKKDWVKDFYEKMKA
jgi:hypothetical protein